MQDEIKFYFLTSEEAVRALKSYQESPPSGRKRPWEKYKVFDFGDVFPEKRYCLRNSEYVTSRNFHAIIAVEQHGQNYFCYFMWKETGEVFATLVVSNPMWAIKNKANAEIIQTHLDNKAKVLNKGLGWDAWNCELAPKPFIIPFKKYHDHKFHWQTYHLLKCKNKKLAEIKIIDPSIAIEAWKAETRAWVKRQPWYVNRSEAELPVDRSQDDDPTDPWVFEGGNYNGFSRKDIDDAFEGDPNMTWNAD